MPRVAALSLLAAAAALAVLTALPATAQLPTGATPTATLTISPARSNETNPTTSIADFDVTLTVGGLTCLGSGPFNFPVTLASTISGSDSAVASVEPRPAVLQFQVPAGVTVIQSYQQTLTATLIVQHHGDVTQTASVPVGLTASLPAGSGNPGGAQGGCQGASQTPSATASGNFTAHFTAPAGVVRGSKGPAEPAPELGLVAIALAAVVLVLRRK